MNSSYRENSLSAGDSLRSHCPSGREGLSLVPSPASRPTTAPHSSCCSHHCAHHASGTQPTQAPAPSLQHRCILQPLQADLGPGWRSMDTEGQGALHRGRSSSHGGPELSYIWTAQCNQKHCTARPTLSSRVSANHGWWFAATLCPEHKWSHNPCISPHHLLIAPGPILTGTDVPSYSNASTAKEQHPPLPWQAGGSWGSPQPVTPGCFLPPGTCGSSTGSRDWSGREEGFLLLPRLPEN